MKDLLSLQSFLLFLSMLAVTYSTRLIGFFALRDRMLSRRAQVVMEAAPGCVLISVIAPYFVSDKPHELIAIALSYLDCYFCFFYITNFFHYLKINFNFVNLIAK